MTLLLSKTINYSKDFFEFESEIRKLIGCDSTYCALFQSADYIELKFLVQSVLRRKQLLDSNFSRVLYIPRTSYVIHLMDDNKTFIVKDQYDDLMKNVSEKQNMEPDTKKIKLDVDQDSQKCLFEKFTNKLFSSRGNSVRDT